MKEFDAPELAIMGAFLTRALEFANETDAPTVVIAHLESVLEKIDAECEKRIAQDQEFQSIAESLAELQIASEIIEKNIDAEIPEYK